MIPQLFIIQCFQMESIYLFVLHFILCCQMRNYFVFNIFNISMIILIRQIDEYEYEQICVVIYIIFNLLHGGMVYGRILYNNIKEYTPKWYPTVPYSQTVKPVFGRKTQLVSNFNASPAAKSMWRNFAFVFQRHSFMWQVLIVGFSFLTFHFVYDPILFIYRKNNEHRSFQACKTKEIAYKKKMRELEEAEEAEEAE